MSAHLFAWCIEEKIGLHTDNGVYTVNDFSKRYRVLDKLGYSSTLGRCKET